MKKNLVLPITLMIITVILAIVCYFILPETVIIQISTGGNHTTAPKLVAIVLSFLLGVGGAGLSIFARADARVKKKQLLVSIVGIFVFIIMIIVNCFIK